MHRDVIRNVNADSDEITQNSKRQPSEQLRYVSGSLTNNTFQIEHK
jgi:hypothetical protein